MTDTPGKLQAGATVPVSELTTMYGHAVQLTNRPGLIHLQFRRFAGCPLCNMRLRSFVVRHEELTAAGIEEVVVFHAPADELRKHTSTLPFWVIADPEKRAYVAFKVESAPPALLNPRVWGPIVRAVLQSLWGLLRGRERPPRAMPHGGRLGLPADFLIADGQVVACKYGDHAYDQWSVDELMALTREVRDPAQASSKTAYARWCAGRSMSRSR
jgi:peroxiredoxin